MMQIKLSVSGLRTKVQCTLTFMPVVMTHFSAYVWRVFIGHSYTRHVGGRFLFISYDAPE